MGILDGVLGPIVQDVADLFGPDPITVCQGGDAGGGNPANPGGGTNTNAQLLVTNRGFDPRTGISVPQTVTYSVNIFPPTAFKDWEYKGTDIQAGDLKALLPTDQLNAFSPPVVPDDSMTLQFGGKKFKIINADPVYVGSDIISYQLRMRG